LSLGLAGLSMAQAQPSHHHSTHGLPGTMSDMALDSQDCCDQPDAGRHTGSCSMSGHCVACAVANAGMPAPEFSSTACLGLRLPTFPVGRDSVPAGHPPKAS
jgi:hypothetical protein